MDHRRCILHSTEVLLYFSHVVFIQLILYTRYTFRSVIKQVQRPLHHHENGHLHYPKQPFIEITLSRVHSNQCFPCKLDYAKNQLPLLVFLHFIHRLIWSVLSVVSPNFAVDVAIIVTWWTNQYSTSTTSIILHTNILIAVELVTSAKSPDS